MALLGPCIRLLKGHIQTLNPSFFLCLQAFFVLLRFSSRHCRYLALWQPPHRCSSLKVRPLPIERCYCDLVWVFTKVVKTYLEFSPSLFPCPNPRLQTPSSFVSAEVLFLETVLDVCCTVNPFLPFCRRFSYLNSWLLHSSMVVTLYPNFLVRGLSILNLFVDLFLM